MGFYDNYNFDGLKFFSQLQDKAFITVSTPCQEFLSVIKHLKYFTPPHTHTALTVAEVGIGVGATALQVLRMLDKDDTYYAFDFEDSIKNFIDDLNSRDFGIKCQVIVASNSHNEWDSYNWNLSNMIFQMRKQKQAGVFDAVYLDGAHTFLHDGLAVCLLKELIKDGGFLILDDLFWRFAGGKYGEATGPGRLTRQQMEDYQILRVQEIFLSNDPNFERLSPPNAYRGVFRKRPR